MRVKALFSREDDFHDPHDFFDWDHADDIGDGAFATVYRATCTVAKPPHRCFAGLSESTTYAVKVIQRAKLNHNKRKCGQRWDHLQLEISVSTTLRSPHCVRLYDAFYDEERVYLVMELVLGGTLFKRIAAAGGVLSEAGAQAVTRQLLRALQDLHQSGVLHGDVKMANILMVSPDPANFEVKVADFGLATHLTNYVELSGKGTPSLPLSPSSPPPPLSAATTHAVEAARLAAAADLPSPCLRDTRVVARTLVGTMEVMAPELLQQWGPRGGGTRRVVVPWQDAQKADVFALGITCSFMLLGRDPFASESVRERLGRIRQQAQFTAEEQQRLSAEAREFCHALLQEKCERRPLAGECWSHPWLQQQQQQQRMDVTSTVISTAAPAVAAEKLTLTFTPPLSPSCPTVS